MSRHGMRWIGAGMTASAVVALLVAHALFGATPVGASECCQVCEAKEAACYSSCENISHDAGDPDSLEACYTECDNALYDSVHGCYTHCTYCGQPPSPSQCYQCTTYHYSVCQMTFLEGQWYCLWQYEGHDVQCSQTQSGFCTPS